MLQRIDEMTTPPVVGQAYLVPCVTLPQGLVVPVMGPRHEDPEINAPRPHWHANPQFMSRDDLMSAITGAFLGKYPDKTAILLALHDEETIAAQALGVIVTADGPPVEQERICIRPMPPHPGGNWLGVLEDLYAERTAKCGRCPHRGFALGPAAPDGTATCPGHGLRFDASTGRLVRRTP